jgi:hypothetical protein
MLSTAAGRGVQIVGLSRTMEWQLSAVEIVAFGRRRDRTVFPWPVQEVDSFAVRGSGGVPARDGILRREPRGDVLVLRDGGRLALPRLPETLAGADGKRVWIAGPLDAPTWAGVLDPARPRPRCDE